MILPESWAQAPKSLGHALWAQPEPLMRWAAPGIGAVVSAWAVHAVLRRSQLLLGEARLHEIRGEAGTRHALQAVGMTGRSLSSFRKLGGRGVRAF